MPTISPKTGKLLIVRDNGKNENMRCSISAVVALAVVSLLLIVSVPGCTATPTITLTPSSGFASTTVTGELTPSSTVTIKWDGTVIPTVPMTVTTDESGSFTAIISVPYEVGPHTVTAVDNEGYTASATFTVENMTEQLQLDLEELQSTVDNLGIDIKNLSALLGENTISELNDAIADILAQLEEEEETGESLMVFAITDDGFMPLTSGFAPGSSMLMMLMFMQDGGGFFGIQELPHEDTPILLMDSAGGLVPNASVTLYLAGENAFAPITLPVFGGISMIPRTEGMIMGTVSAPGYGGVSFFARMGEATNGTTPTEHIYFTTVATMKVGEPNVLRAVDQAGKLAGGTIKIQDPDADPQLQEGPNPLSFVPGSESFTVSLMQDGEEIAMDTLQVPKPKGGGDPWGAVIGVSIVILVAYFAYRYKIKGRGLWWKKGGKKPPLG